MRHAYVGNTADDSTEQHGEEQRAIDTTEQEPLGNNDNKDVDKSASSPEGANAINSDSEEQMEIDTKSAENDEVGTDSADAQPTTTDEASNATTPSVYFSRQDFALSVGFTIV